MYHAFNAWWVKLVINNEQSLKTTLAFVSKLAKLGCGSIIFSI